MKNYTLVIRRHDTLTEEQLNSAFRVGETTPWWVALVQIIDDTRMDFALRVPQNSLGINPAENAFKDAGAFEALTGLLVELEKRRQSAQ